LDGSGNGRGKRKASTTENFSQLCEDDHVHCSGGIVNVLSVDRFKRQVVVQSTEEPGLQFNVSFSEIAAIGELLMTIFSLISMPSEQNPAYFVLLLVSHHNSLTSIYHTEYFFTACNIEPVQNVIFDNTLYDHRFCF